MSMRRWTRIAVLTASAGVGYALVYYLDPRHGTARRRMARARLSELAGLARSRVAGLLEPAPRPRAAPPRHVTHVTVDPAGARAEARIVAFDEVAPQPPPAASGTEPTTEAAPVRRGAARPLAVLAAALALVAAGLAAWIVARPDERPAAAPAVAAVDESAYAIALISRPGAQRIPVSGSSGNLILVVAPDGEAALIVSDVPHAPADKTYEAWVVVGDTATPAALFRGGERAEVVRMDHPVPRGALVAVSLEPAGGVARSDSPPLYVAKRS